MRKLVVNEFMSLDGVAQAPGGADEDTSGSFAHGGWHMRYMDEQAQRSALGAINEAGAFLLGRRTYEIFAAYWPHAPAEEQVVAEPLNAKPKYVASTTLADPLEWQNSRLLQGEVAEAAAALKQDEGGDLHVIGSTELVKTLIEHDLVDELRLMIDPLVSAGARGSSRTMALCGRYGCGGSGDEHGHDPREVRAGGEQVIGASVTVGQPILARSSPRECPVHG